MHGLLHFKHRLSAPGYTLPFRILIARVSNENVLCIEQLAAGNICGCDFSKLIYTTQ